MTNIVNADNLVIRAQLEDVLYRYYDAVDKCRDFDNLLGAFTEDATFDVSDLGLKSYKGRDEIRGFFEEIFAGVDYHLHHVTNFHVISINSDKAKARAYIYAKAKGHDGPEAAVHCSIDIDYVHTSEGWKMHYFDEDFIMPMGSEIAEMHGMN